MNEQRFKYVHESRFNVQQRVIVPETGQIMQNPVLSFRFMGHGDMMVVAQQGSAHLTCPPCVLSQGLGQLDELGTEAHYLDLVVIDRDMGEDQPRIYVVGDQLVTPLIELRAFLTLRKDLPAVLGSNILLQTLKDANFIDQTGFIIVGNLYEYLNPEGQERIKTRLEQLKSGEFRQGIFAQKTVVGRRENES